MLTRRRKDPRKADEKALKFISLQLCAELAAGREAKRLQSKARYAHSARNVLRMLHEILERHVAALEAELDELEPDAEPDVDTPCPSAAFQLTFKGER